jgi:hypothetical protein
VPINIDDGKANHLANTIGCSVGSMPFTYLALPLGTTRPIVDEFSNFLNRIEKCMMGINMLLRYSERLLLVNSILSTMPTFYILALKMPIKILDHVDKYKKNCLWNRGDINRKGVCLVA